ncbi:protoheme IX biogenesis protein HemY, partial [Escherichia coli]|nr:protoheme IX biogenesis protein HemY [Escherichia coli]
VQQHLERAAELADTNQLPVDITRVRILLAQNENHAARTGVDELLNQAPRHPEVLRLAEVAYTRTAAWQALLDIIPSMQKIALHTDDELEQLRQKAYIGIMGQKMSENGCDGLK